MLAGLWCETQVWERQVGGVELLMLVLSQDSAQALHTFLNLCLTCVGERDSDKRARVCSSSTLTVCQLACKQQHTLQQSSTHSAETGKLQGQECRTHAWQDHDIGLDKLCCYVINVANSSKQPQPDEHAGLWSLPLGQALQLLCVSTCSSHNTLGLAPYFHHNSGANTCMLLVHHSLPQLAEIQDKHL